MNDLYLSELRRFRNAALIFGAAHLVLQLIVNRMTDLLQQRWEIHLLVLAVYFLAGFGFALYQFGSYRQPGRWLWLLHRPLPRAAIFGAIALASVTLIVLAVGLPALLALLGIEALSERTVDARHFLLVLHLVLLTVIAWLAGSAVVLSRSKSALVIVLLPWLMLGHLASAATMLVPALLCVALLAFVVYTSFKPHRAAPPESAAALLATALPLQLGFYLALLWSGTVLFQFGQMLADVHPLSRGVPPAGGYIEAARADKLDVLRGALAMSADPRAAQLRGQVEQRAPIDDIEPAARQFPVRHQASNQDELKWHDGGHHVEWTFSHDAMRFHGRDSQTGRARGWLGLHGLDDAQPLPAVPLLALPYIMTPQQLYRLDEDTLQVVRLIALQAPETLAGPPKLIGRHWYVLTNHRLIAYDPSAERWAKAPLAQRFSVALPGPFNDLDRVVIEELPLGALLAFNYGRHMIEGESGSAQALVLVDPAGRAQLIARRALAHDFPPLFEQRDWWLSPLLHSVLAVPDLLLDKGIVLDRGLQRYANQLRRPRPAPAVLAAVLMALLSAGAAWAWLRTARVSRERKAGWLVACLLIGAPALLSLMLLQPRAARVARSSAVPFAI